LPDAQSVDAIFSAKKLAETLEQNPLGARFEPKEDKLSIASSGEPSDIEADKDVTTRQMHEPTRLRADELAARALRLANQPAWQGLSTTATNFRNLLNQDTDAIAAQVGIVWAELVSLGSYVEQDNEIKENPKADVEPLAPDIRRPLTDLVQSAGPWLRRFPTARRLDEEHAAFQTPKNRVPAAIKLITDADDREVVDSDDASIIQAALEVGQGTGHQTGKARSYGVLSVRNLSMGAIGLVATSMIGGYFTGIGETIAQHSLLATKIEAFVLDNEVTLVRFISDLPADVRAGVRQLIEDLKERLASKK
jgi:hypothetical protein